MITRVGNPDRRGECIFTYRAVNSNNEECFVEVESHWPSHDQGARITLRNVIGQSINFDLSRREAGMLAEWLSKMLGIVNA